jgi:hypothetical protein
MLVVEPCPVVRLNAFCTVAVALVACASSWSRRESKRLLPTLIEM